jgi:hypothetical protein
LARTGSVTAFRGGATHFSHQLTLREKERARG